MAIYGDVGRAMEYHQPGIILLLSYFYIQYSYTYSSTSKALKNARNKGCIANKFPLQKASCASNNLSFVANISFEVEFIEIPNQKSQFYTGNKFFGGFLKSVVEYGFTSGIQFLDRFYSSFSQHCNRFSLFV